ncbi:MAG: UTP--glucose-1-phosphate uridylyltransferase [Lachnospiraceae bacterium]|nr:UTP--glucose-1-phosphate uridylyltransferase [Lachnospiraceae bacterium]
MTYQDAAKKLKMYGQEHVLKYFDELSEGEKSELLEQIELTDFSVIEQGKSGKAAQKGVITPLASLELDEINENKARYTELGIKAIKEGKVAAVLLAGGMGTRLGSDDPKGMYNIGKTKDVYIFQRLIENLMDIVELVQTDIYMFVMTSDKNHTKTVNFFKEHNYFGYKEEYIKFFMQEMAPATDYDGKVYLESKCRISNSPNGNGGWFSSMKKWGILDIIHNEGIEYLNVFAVDNVLQKIADPAFVGAVMEREVEAGAKVVKKAAPDEKVGVMCLEDGKPSVIEYYELTDQLVNTLNEKGERVYNFGAILNYLFKVSALERIVDNKLPVHIVEKKIPYMDEKGNSVKPETPNGHKYELLILDMIHELKDCLPYEVVRNHEFAPIKNKTGIDSVESARELLEENGYIL